MLLELGGLNASSENMFTYLLSEQTYGLLNQPVMTSVELVVQCWQQTFQQVQSSDCCIFHLAFNNL